MDKTNSHSLPVTILREGERFVAYSPALDLSSAGSSEKDARRMFAEAVEAFFEELISMGTIDSVLKDLGWTKSNGKFVPPEVVNQSMVSVFVPLAA